jgi:hypothetical protein
MGRGWNDRSARAAKGQEDGDPGKTVHKTESRIQTIPPFDKPRTTRLQTGQEAISTAVAREKLK